MNVVQSNDGRGETMSFKRDEPRTSGFQIAKGPVERTTTIEKTKDGLGFPCCYRHKEYGIRVFGCADVENCRYIEIVDPLKARDPSVPTMEEPLLEVEDLEDSMEAEEALKVEAVRIMDPVVIIVEGLVT